MILTNENKADSPTPTPIQKSGDPLQEKTSRNQTIYKLNTLSKTRKMIENYMVDEDGGGTGTLGEATEVVC